MLAAAFAVGCSADEPADESASFCEVLGRPVGRTTLGALLASPPGEAEVFLEPDLSPGGIEAVGRALEEEAGLVLLEFVSQEENFDLFQEMFADRPEFLENVTAERLAHSFRVVLVPGMSAEELVQRYEDRPGVRHVVIGGFAGLGNPVDPVTINAVLGADTDAPAVVEDAWTSLLASIDDVAAAAPNDLTDEVASVAEPFREVARQLERAGWDLDRYDSPTTEPPLSDILTADDDRFETAAERDCGLELPDS